MNGGENKIVTHSATQLPNGGKQPVSNKLVIAVVSLAILTFLGILSETSLNIAYSTPMEEFSIGASVVQWLVTGYLLLLSVSIPSSPFMVRKFATKTLFIMAIVIFTAGTLLGALAVNFPMLLAARLVMSLGAGISLPLITNIILEKAPLEQRGAMLGIVSLVTCAAPAIGPVIGGMLKNHFPPKFILIGFAGTVIMDVVFVALSGNVGGGIAANDGADAAGSYMVAFPRSMMVFTGMAVLGVILAALMFRFSTRRPPELREVK